MLFSRALCTIVLSALGIGTSTAGEISELRLHPVNPGDFTSGLATKPASPEFARELENHISKNGPFAAQAALSLGHRHLTDSQPHLAKTQFRMVADGLVSGKPGDRGLASVRLGALYLKDRDYATAEQYLRPVVGGNLPVSHENAVLAGFNLASVYHRTGRAKTALALYESIRKQSKDAETIAKSLVRESGILCEIGKAEHGSLEGKSALDWFREAGDRAAIVRQTFARDTSITTATRATALLLELEQHYFAGDNARYIAEYEKHQAGLQGHRLSEAVGKGFLLSAHLRMNNLDEAMRVCVDIIAADYQPGEYYETAFHVPARAAWFRLFLLEKDPTLASLAKVSATDSPEEAAARFPGHAETQRVGFHELLGSGNTAITRGEDK